MLEIRDVRFAWVMVAVLAWCAPGAAQDPGKGKAEDEALDSLIEKLADPDRDQAVGKPAPKDETREKDKNEPKPALPASGEKKEAGGQESKGKAKLDKGQKAGDVVDTRDKDLDDLLEKLGETKDEPTPEDRPKGRPPQPGQKPEGPQKGGGGDDKKDKVPGLQGKDKDLDEQLEEFAGKRRKKNQSDKEEGSGALGQVIKEMRDVEQRLGKTDTGDGTRGKQKQIVKQIDTLIQQIRQSGASGMMAMRKSSQGQKQGNQPGQTPGATAGGAPASKPGKPNEPRALAGGKDIWGHLPPELRQEMENVFKEGALPAKQDDIRRYYLSLSKRKVVRGE